MIICRVSTRSYLHHVSIVVGHEGRVFAIDISIIFRRHITTTTPGFIANAPIFHMPWLVLPVFAPPVTHRAYAIKVYVLHPISQLLNSTTTYVTGEVWFGANFLAHIQEVVRTKTVVFRYAAPPFVYHGWAFFFRTNTIFPMIRVCKATTRPAKHRHFQFAQCSNNVVSYTISIRNFRSITYIKA